MIFVEHTVYCDIAGCQVSLRTEKPYGTLARKAAQEAGWQKRGQRDICPLHEEPFEFRP